MYNHSLHLKRCHNVSEKYKKGPERHVAIRLLARDDRRFIKINSSIIFQLFSEETAITISCTVLW